MRPSGWVTFAEQSSSAGAPHGTGRLSVAGKKTPLPGHFFEVSPSSWGRPKLLYIVLRPGRERVSVASPTCEGVEHGRWLQQIVPLLPEGEEDADCSDDCKANAEDGNGRG